LSDLEIVDGLWWIPGDHGAVYVRRGPTASLEPVIEPVLEPFRAIWGTGDGDLYLVGPGLILHHNGGIWTPAQGGTIYAVNGVSGILAGEDDEVWAVGGSPGSSPGLSGGEVFHRSGGSWARAQIDPSHPLNAVWAAAPGEAIAVGDGGAVWRYAAGA